VALDTFLVRTARLELLAATPETARAEQVDRQALFRLLEAEPPAFWPPPLNDSASLGWAQRFLEASPAHAGWATWYFALPRSGAGGRVLVGNGGFKGTPAADGTVEIGYSLLPAHHRQGLGTEAAGGLVQWAFSHPEVTRVIAETYPYLLPSIRVLEKNGFTLIGAGSEPDVIRFEKRR
jgi:RimJ/RimL family protein N-acetyltransferase